MLRFIRIALEYLFPAYISAIAGLVSIGSGIAGMAGGAPSPPTAGGQPYWVGGPRGDYGIPQTWFNDLNNIYGQSSGIPNTVQPWLQQSLNNQLGINYGPYLNAANTAGSQYGQLGGLTSDIGSILTQLSGGTQQLGNQAYGAGAGLLPQLLGAGQNANTALTGAVPGLTGQLQGALPGLMGQESGYLSQLSGALPGLLGATSGVGQNVYNTLGGVGQNLNSSLGGIAGNILNTSMDPQEAMYQRSVGQLTDQIRAGQAARGLGTSPVGGAEENEALSNFNIDWQNQQLQRQIQGGQTAGNLLQGGAQTQGNLLQGGAATLGNLNSQQANILNALIGQQSNITGQQGQLAQGFTGEQANILNLLYGGGASALSGLAGTGAGAYGNLGGLGLQGNQLSGNQLAQALAALAQVPGFTMQSGQVPLGAAQTAAGAPGQAANAYTAGMTSSLSDLLQTPQFFNQFLTGGGTGVPQAVPSWNPYGQAGSALGSGFSQFGNSQLGGQFNNWLNNLFTSNTGGGGGGTPQIF